MKRKYVIALGVVIVLLLLISTAALASNLGKLANPDLMDTPMTDSSPFLAAQQPGIMTHTGLMVAGPDSSTAANNLCPIMDGTDASTGTGMGMVNVDTAQSNGITAWLSNPWLMLGWSLLSVVVLTILFGIGSGIFWMVRQTRVAAPVQKD